MAGLPSHEWLSALANVPVRVPFGIAVASGAVLAAHYGFNIVPAFSGMDYVMGFAAILGLGSATYAIVQLGDGFIRRWRYSSKLLRAFSSLSENQKTFLILTHRTKQRTAHFPSIDVDEIQDLINWRYIRVLDSSGSGRERYLVKVTDEAQEVLEKLASKGRLPPLSPEARKIAGISRAE